MCSNQTQVSTDSLLKLQVSKQIEGKTLFTNLLLGNYVPRNAKLLTDAYRKCILKRTVLMFISI